MLGVAIQRPIGTLRRDCLDHVVILGERHLRRILTLYSLYYNETRTHRSPCRYRSVSRCVQSVRNIIVKRGSIRLKCYRVVAGQHSNSPPPTPRSRSGSGTTLTLKARGDSFTVSFNEDVRARVQRPYP